MSTFGQTEIFRAGAECELRADGETEWFPIGETIDWSLVAAPGGDVTLPDGTVVKSGRKYLRYGQVMCKVTAQSLQTLTVTATGGTYTLTGYRPDTGAYVTTAAIAYNANSAAVTAALTDPAVFGTSIPVAAVVTGVGPYSVAITGVTGVLTPGTAGLTGGTATMAQTTPVANSGKYGPWDVAATDGRQTLTRGECGVLNRTTYEFDPFIGYNKYPSDHGALLVGGLVWRARLLATAGTHSLAAGPTYAEVQDAFPRLMYAPFGV